MSKHVPATLLTQYQLVRTVFAVRAFRFLHSIPIAMGLTSTNESGSIFKDGKLKPVIYKIQNIVSQTYVDIREHTRELCGRPATLLEGKGLVGSHPCLTQKTVVMVIFSGKYFFPVPDTPYAGCSVDPPFSLPCTERDNIARTRKARTILHHTLRIGKRKYCIHRHLSCDLEGGDCSQRALPWM